MNVRRPVLDDRSWKIILSQLKSVAKVELPVETETRRQNQRHRRVPGHSNVLVEIKTISPHKGSDTVRVKRTGNFGALVVVKFDADFRVDAKVIRRKNLPKGDGKWIGVRWSEIRCERKYFAGALDGAGA